MSRVVGVTSEGGLTTDRYLSVPTCLRNTTTFIPPRYQKSYGASHHTTYGISTLVGYLMPNPIYIYIYTQYIHDCKQIVQGNTILKQARAHLFVHS